jgi:hypothetical protein
MSDFIRLLEVRVINGGFLGVFMGNLRLKYKEMARSAPIFKRLLAFVLDLIIIDVFVLFPIGNLVGDKLGINLMTYKTFMADPVLVSVFSVIAFFIGIIFVMYFVLQEWLVGQTVGKWVFGITVENGNFWSLIVRSLFIMPVFPLFILWVVEPLFIVFNPDSRRLLEILSKTKTVEKYKGVEL